MILYQFINFSVEDTSNDVYEFSFYDLENNLIAIIIYDDYFDYDVDKDDVMSGINPITSSWEFTETFEGFNEVVYQEHA